MTLEMDLHWRGDRPNVSALTETHDQLLNLDTVMGILNHRRRNVHVVLTGCNASYELMHQADLVTEMRQTKSPAFTALALTGIEF